MAAARKKNTKLAETTRLNNAIHNLQSLLDREFSNDVSNSGSADLITTAAQSAVSLVQHIKAASKIPTEERKYALFQIYSELSTALKDLDTPEFPDIHWEDRGKKNRFMSPCDFVIQHYPNYGKNLTLNAISAHDHPLYNALNTKKKKGEWKEGFDLPTQHEANDRALEKLGGKAPTLKEIADQAPPNIRDMLRLYEVARSRKRNTKSAQR